VGGAFTLAFNSAITGAAVDALFQWLAYANISDAPMQLVMRRIG
jgi:hypothetical protein